MENKIELAVRTQTDVVVPFISNPNHIRYDISEIKVGDTVYLKKIDTDKEFRVSVLKIDKVFTGEVTNTEYLFDEINHGDIFTFVGDNIFGVTE